MIKSVTITNHLNESITMELRFPEKSGFLVLYIDGLDPTKANIDTTEVSSMDGSIYNSTRATSRNIVFKLGFLDNDMSIEDARQLSYKYFPIKKRVNISIETDNRICETYGYVESNVVDIFSEKETAIISIVCPDAYLYSVEIQSTSYSSVESLFEFPFSNESLTENLITITELNVYNTTSINYVGDSPIGIVMNIHAIGEATNIEILNVQTRESIQIDTDRVATITGSGIKNGDDIIISTVKGDKYAILVRDGIEYNIINSINKYPSWFQLEKGSNLFTYLADFGSENLEFTIENQIAYEGI
jgi:hypothetical protein